MAYSFIFNMQGIFFFLKKTLQQILFHINMNSIRKTQMDRWNIVDQITAPDVFSVALATNLKLMMSWLCTVNISIHTIFHFKLQFGILIFMIGWLRDFWSQFSSMVICVFVKYSKVKCTYFWILNFDHLY